MRTKLVGWTTGGIGGLYKYFAQVNVNTDFMQKLFEAAITAAVCATIGALINIGLRELVDYIKKLFNGKSKVRRKPNQ